MVIARLFVRLFVIVVRSDNLFPRLALRAWNVFLDGNSRGFLIGVVAVVKFGSGGIVVGFDLVHVGGFNGGWRSDSQRWLRLVLVGRRGSMTINPFTPCGHSCVVIGDDPPDGRKYLLHRRLMRAALVIE